MVARSAGGTQTEYTGTFMRTLVFVVRAIKTDLADVHCLVAGVAQEVDEQQYAAVRMGRGQVAGRAVDRHVAGRRGRDAQDEF